MRQSDLIKKVKGLEIQTRQRVQNVFSGGYHSAFKGQGLLFSEVRNYAFGDDVRLIDWRITAKTGQPHIKIFQEERELTVLLMVDVSRSTQFGSSDSLKRDRLSELAAVLGFSAHRNRDRIGLVMFSDKIEKYIPAERGAKTVFKILSALFETSPKDRKTSLKTALDFVLRVCPKRAIVFLISDFLDSGYESAFRQLKQKHDVVPVILTDRRESELPNVGLVRLEDLETGSAFFLDTSAPETQRRYAEQHEQWRTKLTQFFGKNRTVPISLLLQSPYDVALRTYFKARARQR